ncbi:MAG: SWIM zinc finger family protein [Candidatus Hydrogenedentota bacterium]
MRQENVAQDPATQQDGEPTYWVVIAQDDGFRVYSTMNPGATYDVKGTPEVPTCTCADFQWKRNKPGYRCVHILAVYREAGVDSETRTTPPTPRQPLQQQPVPSAAAFGNNGNGELAAPTHMVVKRSVSPDGRIDSLSVEFTHPVEGIDAQYIVDQAVRTVSVQGAIVTRFLQHRRNATKNRSGNGGAPAAAHAPDPPYPSGEETEHEPDDEDSEPAWMTDMDGMQTRSGWRWYINVKADRRAFRLFGTRTQIAQHLAAAGFPDRNVRIEKGTTLNHPCRVVTRPSADGRYVNIVRVFPKREGSFREDEIPY